MNIGEILGYGWQFLQTLLSSLQQVNAFLLNNFGGILLIVAAVVAVVAYRKASEITKNQRAMERLADAMIRQQNRSRNEEE